MLKIFILIILLNYVSYSEINYGISGGFVYGGPIPTKTDDKSSGQAGLGPFLSFNISYPLNSIIGINSAIMISHKSVSYNSSYTKDTIVEATINGQTGNLETYYRANIDGSISIIYIDMPILLNINITKKSMLFLGLTPSFNLSGRNDIALKIKIGEGGFIKDIIKHYDNYKYINIFDLALSLGGRNQLYKNIYFRFLATRSVIPLFTEDFKPNDEVKVSKLYNTHFFAGIEYIF